MLAEAAVGAGLVLFGLVVKDDSVARAVVMCIHLVNTFLLLAAVALTALWAGDVPLPRWRPGAGVLLAGLGAMLLVGASGAIAALGDTLFPARDLAEGLAQDASPTAHVLLRLRVLHPILALGAAVLVAVAASSGWSERAAGARKAALALLVLFGAQLVAGLVNVALLAPVWMQLVHLLLADLAWLALVVLAARVLAVAPEPPPAGEPAVRLAA
jgi:heme A synthase